MRFTTLALTFDAVSMSGAGAVVGLYYLAPKGLTPAEALRNTMNFGVSDAIYSLLPMNYKVFFKGGPLADAFRNFWRKLPPVQYAEHQYGMSPAEKLESDLLLLAGSMATPTDMNFFDQGDMRPRPLHRGHRGFQKIELARVATLLLERLPNRHQRRSWSSKAQKIDIRHFRAAFSFRSPIFMPPTKSTDLYTTKPAAFTGLNLVKLAVDQSCLNIKYVTLNRMTNAWRFIVFDVL